MLTPKNLRDGFDNQSFANNTTEYMLCLALDIGEGMLKCGGEIHRVEDTIERICRAYGAKHIEIFAIPSVIIAAIRMPDGEYSSQIRRVKKFGNDLACIERLNEVSRYVCNNTPPLSEMDTMIRQAKEKKSYPKWLHFLSYAMASGAFAVFFGGSWKDGVVAALIGMVFAFIDLIQLDRINQFAKIAMQSFVGGLLSCVAVRFGLGDDVGMIMIGTIMILIPGVFFSTALRDLLCGDFLAGTLKTVQALLSTLMIAFGYLLAMLLVGGVV
jgi:uncharacterized membrane protein YjjP (DUF1212 family)